MIFHLEHARRTDGVFTNAVLCVPKTRLGQLVDKAAPDYEQGFGELMEQSWDLSSDNIANLGK